MKVEGQQESEQNGGGEGTEPFESAWVRRKDFAAALKINQKIKEDVASQSGQSATPRPSKSYSASDPHFTPSDAPALVTRSRFVYGGTTFPVANIASYRHTYIPEKRTPPDRGRPALLLAIGAAMVLVGLVLRSQLMLWVGGLVAIIAILWLMTQAESVVPAVHTLSVTSASGADLAVVDDASTINAIHDALDKAVALLVKA